MIWFAVRVLRAFIRRAGYWLWYVITSYVRSDLAGLAPHTCHLACPVMIVPGSSEPIGNARLVGLPPGMSGAP